MNCVNQMPFPPTAFPRGSHVQLFDAEAVKVRLKSKLLRVRTRGFSTPVDLARMGSSSEESNKKDNPY